jgi:hypothetical protein
VQALLLQVLEQRAPRTVHDALGRTGGAGGVEDVERVIEGKALEAKGRSGVARDERVEAEGSAGKLRLPLEVRHHHPVLHTLELAVDLGTPLEQGVPPAAVEVAVRGDQDLRRDLLEAVEHAPRSEVRRAGGPDRPQTRGRQRRRHRLWKVRQHGPDPVAPPHTEASKRGSEGRHVLLQLCMGDAARGALLATKQQGGTVVAAAQQVLGEVETRLGEPFRAGHAPGAGAEGGAGAVPQDVGKAPDRRPERLGPLHRPGVQRGVVSHANAVVGLDGLGEGGELGGRDAVGRGRPQRLRHERRLTRISCERA